MTMAYHGEAAEENAIRGNATLDLRIDKPVHVAPGSLETTGILPRLWGESVDVVPGRNPQSEVD